MIYDEQCDKFLSSITVDKPEATKTQKLLMLLKHKDEQIRDNAISILTSATCQQKNRDLARQEGLVPLWLAMLRLANPVHRKYAANCVQSLAYSDANKDAIREAGGFEKILAALTTVKTSAVDVALSCLNALTLLSVNQTNREEMAKVEFLKTFMECLEESIDVTLREKTVTVLLNLAAGKTGKTTFREAGAIRLVSEGMKSDRQILRDNSLKILYNLTSTPENREEIRNTEAVKYLLQQLVTLPLPQNEAIVLLNLKMLSNLAFDRAVPNKLDWFTGLVHIINSSIMNLITQALICIQNLLNDEFSVAELYKAGGLKAIYNLAKNSDANSPALQKTSLILGDMLAIEDTQLDFIEFGGLDFLLPLLQSNELESQKSALRAISNLSIYYDEIRSVLASRGCVQIITEYILKYKDRELVRRASMALINLALNHTNEEMIFASGILPKLLDMLADRRDKEIAVLASKILVNLTTNDKIRKSVSEYGGVTHALQMMAEADDEMKFQGAKLVTNLAISGINRKTMHDKGMVATLEQLASTGNNNLKNQIDIALDNCSFPYEQRYDGLNFKLEEKMEPAADEEEDDDEKAERRKEDEELQRQQREEELEALQAEKLKLEEERKRLQQGEGPDDEKEAQEAKEEEARRKEEEEKRKKEEEEVQARKLQEIKEEEEREKRKKAAEEETKRRIAAQESAKKMEEEQKMRKEALTRRRTDHQERIKQMEDEVKKREIEIKRREDNDAKAKHEREEKEKKEKEASFAAVHKAQKRKNAIRELVNIEKNYVTVLDVVRRKFLNPLQASAKTIRPIISQDKIRLIFSIIEVMYNYHMLLLDSVESRLKSWLRDNMTSPLLIGDIYIKWTDYMTCYSTYINNYNVAISTLADCRKTNPSFVQFLKRVQADPECRNQELEYYIIHPVQQLPRYILLLSDCLRNTPDDHPDFPHLSQAVEKIRQVTQEVNEKKREAQDAAAIVNIQQNIRGKFPSLLVSYRKFVKEGFLNFTESGVFRSKEGYVFLFGDLIVFTVKLTSSKKDEYTFREQMSLNANVKIENLKDDSKVKNAFLLKEGSEKPMQYTLSARTPADKTAWMEAIKNVVVNYKPRPT